MSFLLSTAEIFACSQYVVIKSSAVIRKNFPVHTDRVTLMGSSNVQSVVVEKMILT